MKQKNIMAFGIALILFFIPITAFANTPLPFMPSKDEFQDNHQFKSTSTESLTDGLLHDLTNVLEPVYDWGITIITAAFIIGTIIMILSLITKNGQWQKFGQNTMFFSFIVLLLLRGLPVIILSIQSMKDITLMLDAFISALSQTSVYIGMIGIGVSMLFLYGFKLIGHPNFYRWSRALVAGSSIMIALSLIVPILFPTI